ncbi:MAG TPA: TonB-dependent receptor [Lysobacter sp.]
MKRNVLSLALASATLMLAAGAHAQTTTEAAQQEPATADTQATDLDRVVVTGIRAAIESAIETKQSSTSIVESVSAEDIGKLPDTSIADSIARLPGLTAQRFGNRPQEINIRGFAGDFSTALLNGREQVSMGNNRGVEFDQYPSELMNQVVVYKTPDASLIGQGLSGTVDLRTVRPLSFDDRVIAVNARGDINEVEHDDDKLHGNRFSISYIDQFADDTVGLALGYARLDNPTQSHQFNSWGYDAGAIQGADIFDVEGDNTRNGFMGVLEFKPNDMYSTTLDLFYSKFEREETKRGFQFSLQSWTGAALNGRTPATGLATEATYSNVNFGVIRNDFNAAYDDLFSIGWNHELKLNENWTLRADISTSSAKREERILETYARLAPGVVDNNVVATFNPDGYFDFDFSLDLTDPNNFRLMDPGGWGGDRAQAGYLKDFTVKDDLTSLRFDLERSFDSGLFSSLEFGANLTDRTKTRASDENTLCLTAGCTDNSGLAIPSQYIISSDLNFAGITFLGLDYNGLLNDVYILNPKNHPDISKKNWDVNERVSTFYVQANINTDLGSVPVRGNVGVQAVNAEQSSSGFQSLPFGASGGAIEDSASYTYYLPSLNLSFQLPWEQYFRVAAGRQMARPRMDEIRVNNDVSVDQGTSGTLPPEWRKEHYVMTGGNTQLKPWIANAYDVSWEKYFSGTKGYVSVAYFFKDLQTYIYTQNGTFDIRDTTLPPALYDPDIDPIGRFSRPANGTGGFVRGHEIAVSVPLELLWAPLEGFGIQANYSDTDSSIQPNGPDFPSEPLPGLSKYVANGTVYYERFGFAARVSARHRSEFVGEVQGFGGDRTKTSFGAETVTDVQLGYTFQSGPLQDLSILLQVNNIENEPFQTLNGDGYPQSFSEYGRTYLFGVNYKF